jgi:HAMP domain-containing protein
MTIRKKLVGAFLLVALLVPVLGGIAVSRVRSIDGDVQSLTADAVPHLATAQNLDRIQREQQAAVLAYLAGGKAEDRQRYTHLKQQFVQQATAANAAIGIRPDGSIAGGKDSMTPMQHLHMQLGDDYTKFDAAAEQLITAHDSIMGNVETVRVKAEEMVAQLTAIRSRFNPGSGDQPAAASSSRSAPPLELRNQVSQLLFGVEGMMSDVAFESALSSGYALTLNDQLKQRFEDASTAFAGFLQTAKTHGGPDDLVIINQVESKFYKEFEPSARSLMATTQQAAQARDTFAGASDRISTNLEQMVQMESAQVTAARQDARTTARHSVTIMIVITLMAFAVAATLGLWFAGTITGPLRRLRDAADRVSMGDLDGTGIDVNTNDEVGALAAAFRRMVMSVRFLMMRQAADGDAAGLAASAAAKSDRIA